MSRGGSRPRRPWAAGRGRARLPPRDASARVDSAVARPGSVTVAAALRSRSRAPGSTTTRTAMVSPPSGVAAADTRCTVSGSVLRAATPPAHSMRGARPAAATIRTSECIWTACATRSWSRTHACTGPADGSSVSEISTVGPVAAHRRGVAAHHVEVGADHRRQVGLVDHQQVGVRHAGAALARHLVAARDVDDEDLHVDQARTRTSRSGCRRRTPPGSGRVRRCPRSDPRSRRDWR